MLLASTIAAARGGGGVRMAGGGVGGGMKTGAVGAKMPSIGHSGIGNINQAGIVNRGIGTPGHFDNRGIIGPDQGIRHGDFWRGTDINVWGGGWGGYPWYNYGYGYPGYGYGYDYPLYSPGYSGYDPNACYQNCVLSGQYTPEQCAQMCYSPY